MKNDVSKNFEESLKVENVKNEKIKKTIEKEKLLKKLEEDEEVLNMLSIDRLLVLKKYYEDTLAENEEKLRKLKKNNQ